MAVDAAKRGSVAVPPDPLPIYAMCAFAGSESVEIGYTVISLVYDLLAFSLIIYLVARSNLNKVPLPELLMIIAQDATWYFLFIFTSHLMVVLFLLFASNPIKLLPTPGNVVYIPVMITRLLISLKKASASQEHGWSLGEPTTHTTMRFAERRGDVATGHEISLDTFSSTHEGTRSQA